MYRHILSEGHCLKLVGKYNLFNECSFLKINIVEVSIVKLFSPSFHHSFYFDPFGFTESHTDNLNFSSKDFRRSNVTQRL